MIVKDLVCWGLLQAIVVAPGAQAQTRSLVAYTHAPDGGPPWPVEDVYVAGHGAEIGASIPQPLTADGHSHHPVWSPDGKHILFIHDTTLSTSPPYRETEEARSHHPVELSVMDADGSHRRVLRVIEPVIYSAAWSPDGKTIAVSAATTWKPGEAPAAGVFLLSADGQGDLRLLVANAWTPAWSPDGKRLAFTVERPHGSWTVHTANADGTQDITLTDRGVNGGSPAWSRDGKQIAFDRFTDGGRGQQVFLMDADGSNPRQITNDSGWSCMHPTWSPAGGHIAVGCRSAESPCGMGIFSTGQAMPECTRRLFLFPVTDGSTRKPVRWIEGDGATPSFQPR